MLSTPKTIYVFDIEWDTEGESVTECLLPLNVILLDVPPDVTEDKIVETISELLNNAFGFCHDGFDWQILTLSIVTHAGGGFFPEALGVMRWPTKPRVEIRHGADAPSVTTDPAGAVEIIMHDVEAAAQLLLTHGGIKIYRTKNDENLSDYWVAVTPHMSSEHDGAFDWHALDAIAPQEAANYEKMYPNDKEKQILAYNIDLGHITEDGLNQIEF